MKISILSSLHPFSVFFPVMCYTLCSISHCHATSPSLLLSQNIDEHYQSAAIADKHKFHRENCSENGFLNSSVYQNKAASS